MKNLLFSLVLLGLAPAATAQSSRSGSYVPPVAPPKTITTYSTSPGYTPPSQMYNAGRVYTPSYSPSKPSAPATSGADRRTGNTPPEPSSRPEGSNTVANQASFTKMKERYGDMSGAAKTVERAADIDPALLSVPDREKYYGMLLGALNHLEKYAETIKAYEAGLAGSPQLGGTMHETALIAYYFSGQYQRGVEAASRFTHFNSYRGDYYKAVCQTMTGQYGPALTWMQEFLGYGTTLPADFDYHLGRCLLYAPASATERTTRSAQAVGALNRYLAAAGKAAPADLVLMRIEGSYGAGNDPLCVSDASQWLASNPGAGLVYLLRGRAHARLKHPAEARADFAQAVALGVSGHPTLTTADARQLLTPAAGRAAAAGQKKAPAATRPSTKAHR